MYIIIDLHFSGSDPVCLLVVSLERTGACEDICLSNVCVHGCMCFDVSLCYVNSPAVLLQVFS